MDLENAFTQDAILNADADVGGSEEDRLREVIRMVCQANEVELSAEQENMALLCFVAGRTYQSDRLFQISMSARMLHQFMEFLVGRSVQ